MDALGKKLIDRYQRDMPLTPRPYQTMAEDLGVTEAEVIDALTRLRRNNIVSRIGPVFDHAKAGASTLVACAVEPARLTSIGEQISAFEGVNHNYARDHHFNLWFVITAPDNAQLQAKLKEIECSTGVRLLILPMEKAYHIDLGFPIEWNDNTSKACNHE
ncbi:MAG: Lrp/AsnC family transcriptional regulator [Pseudomonadales bacterium]